MFCAGVVRASSSYQLERVALLLRGRRPRLEGHLVALAVGVLVRLESAGVAVAAVAMGVGSFPTARIPAPAASVTAALVLHMTTQERNTFPLRLRIAMGMLLNLARQPPAVAVV